MDITVKSLIRPGLLPGNYWLQDAEKADNACFFAVRKEDGFSMLALPSVWGIRS